MTSARMIADLPIARKPRFEAGAPHKWCFIGAYERTPDPEQERWRRNSSLTHPQHRKRSASERTIFASADYDLPFLRCRYELGHVPTVVAVDNGSIVADRQGCLAPCTEQFFVENPPRKFRIQQNRGSPFGIGEQQFLDGPAFGGVREQRRRIVIGKKDDTQIRPLPIDELPPDKKRTREFDI